MIKEASAQIERVEARERRSREIKYGRRRRIRHIDGLLNELEMLNLTDQSEVPERLAMELNRLLAESAVLELTAQPRPESVGEAMDLLYEIQDTLMFNETDED